MKEQDIITSAFYLAELDTDVWEVGSDEYDLARGLLNLGISRWEGYDSTLWRELLSFLSTATDGDKTITSAYSYACPSNFSNPGGWVRTTGGALQTYYTVIKPEEVSKYGNSQTKYCYFTGNGADGFTLNFNPNITLPVGDTIEYEYYRSAKPTADENDVVEMSDPYFLSYFISAHLGEDGIDQDKFAIAEARLDQMKTKNMAGVFGVPNEIDDPNDFAFGE